MTKINSKLELFLYQLIDNVSPKIINELVNNSIGLIENNKFTDGVSKIDEVDIDDGLYFYVKYIADRLKN